MHIDLSVAVDRIQSMVHGAIALLPNLLIAALVFVIFLVAARLVRSLVLRLVGHRASPGLERVLGRLTQGAVTVIGLFVALTIVVPTLTAGSLVQLLGISSVAVGFAFKDVLQNFLAGILILVTRPFRIGDEIVFGGFEGTVEDIQTRATALRTYDGRRAVIPNSKLFTDAVLVNTAYKRRRSEYDLAFDTGADLDRARHTILSTVSGVDGVLSDPAPEVLTTSVTSEKAVLHIRWWSLPHRGDVVRVQDRVMAAIDRALKDGGIKDGGIAKQPAGV